MTCLMTKEDEPITLLIDTGPTDKTTMGFWRYLTPSPKPKFFSLGTKLEGEASGSQPEGSAAAGHEARTTQIATCQRVSI